MALKRRKAKKKTAVKKINWGKERKKLEKQIKDSSKRKGRRGSGILKGDIRVNFYKPAADEDHVIDIVPFRAGDRMPIDHKSGEPMVAEGEFAYTFDYHQHRGIGPLADQTVLCPEATYRKPCPVCEHRRELIAEKAFDKDNMQELLCKHRNLYNVISYDTDKEEEKGVQLFDAPYVWFEEHISKLASKTSARRRGGRKTAKVGAFKNFADGSEQGVSIEWSIEKAKSKNDFDSWMAFQLVERGDYTLDEYVEEAYQLDQIVQVLSYKELYELYFDEKYEGEEEGEEEEEEEYEEEEADEDDLEEMDRKELRAVIKDEDLDVRVLKSDSDDDLREKIREARGEDEPEEEEEEEEEEERPTSRRRRGRRGKAKPKRKAKPKKKTKFVCPGVLGEDFQEFDECEECPDFDECEELYNQEEGEGEEEEED